MLNQFVIQQAAQRLTAAAHSPLKVILFGSTPAVMRARIRILTSWWWKRKFPTPRANLCACVRPWGR